MTRPDEPLVVPPRRSTDLAELLAERDRAAAALDRLEAAVARQRAQEYLLEAYRDGLTGALQRQAGRDHLVGELARADRAGTTLVLAFLDVVGLKQANDKFGHAVGDLLLASTGAALIGGLRAYDVVVRYGGDEFVCCLPGTSVAEATDRLDDIAEQLRRADPPVEISRGLVLRRPDERLDDLIDRADRAMYDSRRPRLMTSPNGEEPAARRG